MVSLIQAEIFPFRCVERQQTMEFPTRQTVLTGENEAGKTTILECLAKANYYSRADKRFQYQLEMDYPKRKLRELEGIPKAVKLIYSVSEKLDAKILEEMMIPVRGRNFARTAYYDGTYEIDGNDFVYDPKEFWEAYAARKATGLLPYTEQLAKIKTETDFDRFKMQIAAEAGSKVMAELRLAKKYIKNHLKWDNPINEYVYRTKILPEIPRFLYYDACYMLPSKIPMKALLSKEHLTPSDRTAQALLSLTGIPVEKMIQDVSLSSYMNDLEIAQAELNEEILPYWSSNPDLRIEFTLQREEMAEKPAGRRWWFRKKTDYEIISETWLEIRVKDVRTMVSLPLEKRSRGFNWFFSFWVWFQAIEKMEVAPYILLIDEPGMHLHQNAQGDLMKFLGILSKTYQMIYTTHSPYMWEEEKQTIYNIKNVGNGTEIRRKI